MFHCVDKGDSMSYKIYISTTESEECARHLITVKRALFSINEFPVAAIDMLDDTTVEHRMREARHMIDQSDIFIGLYASAYGTVLEGDTQSVAEQEYQYAYMQGKPSLIFVP
jgi:hypothetical protein